MCMWYAHRYVYMHVHMCMGTCVWIREHICGGLTLMVSVFFSHPPLYLSRQDLSNPGPPILVSTASQLTPGGITCLPPKFWDCRRPQCLPVCFGVGWEGSKLRSLHLHTKPFVC